MAPTLSVTALKQAHDNLSTHKALIVDYTGPTSYATGGDPLAPSDLGWGNIDFLDAGGVAWSSGAGAVRLLAWDRVNNKILWFVPNTGSEVAAATDLSGYSARLLFLGQG